MGIATGGAVPAGADAVIPLEYVVDHDNTIEVRDSVELGANIRPAGGDLRQGDVVVDAGVAAGRAQVAALAAAGVAEVRVARRPSAAVLATGSELRRPGEPLEPGQIYEANGVLIEAQLASAGADGRTAEHGCRRRGRRIRAALERGLEADVLVTSGGVSVGPHDLVRRIEAELGVEEVFWGVSVKPGKPISFGVRDGAARLRASRKSGVRARRLRALRPAGGAALQGVAEPRPRFEPGRLSGELARNPTRDELVRARLAFDEEGISVEPLPGRESHMIARAALADALVLVRRGEDRARRRAIRSSSCVSPSGGRRPACAPRERISRGPCSDSPPHEPAPGPEAGPLAALRDRARSGRRRRPQAVPRRPARPTPGAAPETARSRRQPAARGTTARRSRGRGVERAIPAAGEARRGRRRAPERAGRPGCWRS